ncbi:diguanylate cyclase domain-containing protein [Bacilliculturomica massiliensis]|uniref:diguanylate cyclase domain-containing protein n=1 Tax=Bacilliculturomica massiliensis TaxID=1917867 RepID=UPI00103229C7|nr:diguanylate cyclase [Bacilliculturomica massiliensis]
MMGTDAVWGRIDFNIIIKNIPGGVICCDTTPELNLIQYSDNFLQIVGYTRKELEEQRGNRLRDLICPEDREEVDQMVREQLALGNTKKLEYRIVHKDGSCRWIQDQGSLVRLEDGSQVYCCILTDIDEERKAGEELRRMLERHEIIMNESEDIIFEWDVAEDQVVFSPNWKKKFGYEITEKGIYALDRHKSRVFPDDMEEIQAMARELRSGRNRAEGSLRLQKADGRYIWCNVRAVRQKAGLGRSERVVGLVRDIDSMKRNTLQLKERAERDALTGLYNKGTAEELTSAYLQNIAESEACALFMLDLDNFKMINDVYGHLSGDALLGDVAKVLKEVFRRDDILGRTGGDEFLAVMKGSADREGASKKAGDVLARLRRLLYQQQGGQLISGSMGIALFPQDGRDLRTLYHKADIALHQAKASGKDDFRFYSNDMLDFGLRAAGGGEPGGQEERGQRQWNARQDQGREKGDWDGKGEKKAENEIESRGEGFAEYIFRTLYESKDLERDLLLLLEIVGRRYDVSRVYIFEDSEDGTYTVNTFEWCNSGVQPEQENLQHVSYEEVGDFRQNFDENGVFYCKDVAQLPLEQKELLERQGIKAVLQCAMQDEGEIRGLVGFDDCRINRFWTQEQVDALAVTAHMISTFLLKSRARAGMMQLVQSLENILDLQKEWIYAVEKDSFRILYANKQTRTILPSVESGHTCYASFFGKTSPCEGCPVLTLEQEGSVEEKAIYSLLAGRDVWVRVCRQLWAGGKECYLVICR